MLRSVLHPNFLRISLDPRSYVQSQKPSETHESKADPEKLSQEQMQKSDLTPNFLHVSSDSKPYVQSQNPSETHESIESPEKLSQEQMQRLEFINYLGNQKIQQTHFENSEYSQYSQTLFDWYRSMKHSSIHPELKKEEFTNKVGIFSKILSKIWEDPKALSMRIRNKDDLIGYLEKEKQFKEKLSELILTHTAASKRTLVRFLKEGLIEESEGSVYPSFKASPIFVIMTYFLNIGDAMNKSSRISDPNDLRIIFNYYAEKVHPEVMNFRFGSSLNDYTRVFMDDFGKALFNLKLPMYYHQVIRELNKNVEDIKLLQTFRKIHEEQVKNQILAQQELKKTHLKEKNKLLQDAQNDRKSIETASQTDFIEIMKAQLIEKESLVRNTSTPKFFLDLSEKISTEIEELTLTLQQKQLNDLDRINLIFRTFLSDLANIPLQIKEIEQSETLQRKCCVQEYMKKFKQLKLKEMNDQKTCLQIQNLTEYFSRKQFYGTWKSIPVFNQQMPQRAILENLELQSYSQILSQEALEKLEIQEQSARHQLFNEESKNSPKKVHTPYGGFPWRT